MKRIFFIALLGCVAIGLSAQQPSPKSLVYTDGFALKLIGQAFPLSNSYHRIDTTLHRDFPAGIKRLLTHSTGLVLSFKTNSPRIAAKWCVPGTKPYANNMNAIVSKGLDLYIKRNGEWVFASVGRPSDACSEGVLVKDMEVGEKECLLYLPAYDEVKSLSVGIDSGYQLMPGNDPFAGKRVVVYGSSITQGAAASRPGMAYPARLSRELGVNFINLGLSGSGRMEKTVSDMVASIQADAYVLDCFANPSPEQITERTNYIVKAIRAAHPQAPIILIQSVVRENGNFDQGARGYVQRQNDNVLTEYQRLIKEGVKNLYLIEGKDLLGKDHEGTTDGTHPNDIGFDRMLQVIRPEMVRILSAAEQQAPERLKLGFSVPITKLTPELLQKAKANGIDFIETSLKPYMDSSDNFIFPDDEMVRKVKAIKKMADDAQIQVWSIHMPAGQQLDISFPDEAARQRVVAVQKKVLVYCALLAPKIILFHPSFFLGLNERERRKEQMIKSAIELNKAVKDIQATMVIENMFGPELLRDANRERPLMRTVEETVEIMNRLPADIYSAIDLNHIKYPEKLIYAMGKRLKTIHVADGTDTAENHFSPCSGKGHNDWPAIMKALDAVGYNGPFMYESAYKDVDEFKPCYETLYQSLLSSKGK